LPLWGYDDVEDDEIDFLWPSQELFAKMEPDVYLESIEFKTSHVSRLGSVKVNLSNG